MPTLVYKSLWSSDNDASQHLLSDLLDPMRWVTDAVNEDTYRRPPTTGIDVVSACHTILCWLCHNGIPWDASPPTRTHKRYQHEHPHPRARPQLLAIPS